MKADLLVSHFARISDSPNSISNLKGLILDLAIRGSLVEQSAEEESASNLLISIKESKIKILMEDRVRQEKSSSRESDKAPFSIPLTWCWSQLSEIGFINPRNNAEDKSEASFVKMSSIPAGYGIAHLQEKRAWKEIKNGFTHFAEGDVGLAKITPCFENAKSTVFTNLFGGMGAGTTELHIVRPVVVNAEYILLFLKSPHFIKGGIPEMTGTAGQKRVSRDYFAYTPLPLPPLIEQGRIVAKTKELLALCDLLSESQRERDKRREAFSAAIQGSIGRVYDISDRAGWAGFFLENLPHLTKTHDQLKEFRKTILTMAVHGALSAPAQSEETGEELLKKIEESRAHLISKKAIPKPHPVLAVTKEDCLFPIPQGWCWTRLGKLCFHVSDGPHFSPQYVSAEEGYPFLSTRNVRLDRFDLSTVKYVSKENHQSFTKRTKPEIGDVLYTKGGTTGIARVNDLNFEFSVWVHLAVLKLAKEYVDPYFVAVALNSPVCYSQSQMYTQGISNFDLGLTRLIKILLPLPPLEEQRRIVAKVDELMAICDILEEQLSATEGQREVLLESCLHQALHNAGTSS